MIAYERPEGYDLHRSQWGATRLALRWRLTPATPFGGGSPPPVDPTPVHTDVDGSTIAKTIDPCSDEALYVVDQQFDVDAYLIARLDVPGASGTSRSKTGLLAAPVRGELDGCQLRARVEGARSAAGALVTAVTASPATDGHSTEAPAASATDTQAPGIPFVRRALRESIDEWAARTHRLATIDDETL